MNLKFFGTLALVGLCAGQTKNPYAGDAAAAETGRMLFRMSCGGCHGLHAKGGRSGPDLTRGSFSNGDTDADLFRVVSGGVAGTEMPGFRGNLDDDDLWRIISYVQTLGEHRSNTPVKGDRAVGEQLFWGKGSCGQCHRVGARGSTLGPDLTRAGRQRSLAYLRESVVKPDADVTGGYATIVVVTREGKKVEGIEKGFDNFSARLIDLSGNFHSYMRDDVTSIKREYRSLMPSNYERMFSAREMDDLIAYLAGLGGAK